jgi:hypothetical protein
VRREVRQRAHNPARSGSVFFAVELAQRSASNASRSDDDALSAHRRQCRDAAFSQAPLLAAKSLTGESRARLAEQNVAESFAICERGYVLENGKAVLSGQGDEVLADDRVRQAHLGI